MKLNEILGLLSMEDRLEVMAILSDGKVQTPEAQKLIQIAIKAVLMQLAKPSQPAPIPKPPGTAPADLGDETIPAPPPPSAPASDPIVESVVTSLRLKLKQVQLNHARFPEFYTPENEHGLVTGEALRRMERGEDAIPFKSKIWFDATPMNDFGEPLDADQVKAAGLAWKPVWTVEDGTGKAVIKAIGPGVRTIEGENYSILGFGLKNWVDTLGYGLPTQAHNEGEVSVKVALEGVESNVLKLRVS